MYTSKQLVEKAFTGEESEEANKFLPVILSAMKDAANSIQRSVVAIFLLAGVFELLVTSAAIKSLTIGSLSFSNTSLLQKALPAIVSYLIYDTYSLVRSYQKTGVVYLDIIERFQPKLAASDLAMMTVPRIRGPWGFGMLRPPHNNWPLEPFEHVVDMVVISIAFFLFPLAFQIQAYYELVQKYGLHDVLIWISAAASVFFIVVWLAALLYSFSGDDFPNIR